MTYPGGKNGSGVFQAIINQLPPHKVYVEGFLGSGSIMRLKKPAAASIGIETDAGALEMFPGGTVQGLTLYNVDFLVWLAENGLALGAETLVYLDPPYLMETRKSQKPIYKHEFFSETEHRELLNKILSLRCMVAISGYKSGLYADLLKDWRLVTFTAKTRQGVALEHLWMNYREPVELHDDRYLGQNYRERQDIKRKKQRWLKNLAAMKPTERHAFMAAIAEYKESHTGGNTDTSGLF